MLKIKLTGNATAFSNQLKLISNNFDVSICDDGFNVDCEKSNNGLTVTKKGNDAKIIYEKDCEFFRGILTLMENKDDFSIHEKAGFKFNGEMIDNSRNSVLTMETAKKIIIYSAMIGLDNILLYNEETFQVDNNPYFGYMRMGYTQKDVRELTDFAKEFGVTIIPCIQTLAHLAQALRWQCYHDITDHGDTILVEEEKTYALIEDIVKSWRCCVDTNIINIGMDEAFYLGRGQYLDKYGFKEHFSIMCDHLKRVLDICKKYNFKAMMWSDMFFRFIFGDYYSEGEIDPELIKLVPTDVMLVYWDYYSTDEDKYDRLIKQHQKFKNEIGFAGGAWKWSGIVPAINHSHNVSKMALSAAKKNGVSTVFTTAWGDNGAEASIYTILPTLVLHGEVSYSNENVDQKVSSKLCALTGFSLSDFFMLCQPNKTPENNLKPHFNPCKYLFFQDVLMGLFDYHVRDNFPKFFADCHKKLDILAQKNSNVSYVFDTISKLCNVLELKCD
ncbi:MAG: family 20 glycosylhydrolase, partial [Oscillospiraceae bacterium]